MRLGWALPSISLPSSPLLRSWAHAPLLAPLSPPSGLPLDAQLDAIRDYLGPEVAAHVAFTQLLGAALAVPALVSLAVWAEQLFSAALEAVEAHAGASPADATGAWAPSWASSAVVAAADRLGAISGPDAAGAQSAMPSASGAAAASPAVATSHAAQHGAFGASAPSLLMPLYCLTLLLGTCGLAKAWRRQQARLALRWSLELPGQCAEAEGAAAARAVVWAHTTEQVMASVFR